MFDVNVEIPSKFKNLYPKDEIFAQIELYNIGKIGQVDVHVQHFLMKGEEVLDTKFESIGVEAVTSFMRSFALSDIDAGEYSFNTTVSYAGSVAQGGDAFTVRKRIEFIPLFVYTNWVELVALTVLIVLLCLGMGIRIWLQKERRFEGNVLSKEKRFESRIMGELRKLRKKNK